MEHDSRNFTTSHGWGEGAGVKALLGFGVVDCEWLRVARYGVRVA